MLDRITEKWWFRWSLAVGFLVAMFSAAWLGGSPNYQTYYQPEYASPHTEAPTSSDERLADYTEALAIFTCGLLVIGGFQIWLLFRTDKTAKATSGIAERQADAAEKQTLLIGLQADILDKQKEITRTQFFATHRPRLEIKFIRVLPVPHEQIPDEQPVRGEFVIINTGPVGATVTGSRVRFEWFYPVDIPTPPELDGDDVIPHRRFSAGATDKVRIETDGHGGLNMFHGDNTKHLFLLGWVVYVDDRGEEFGTPRTTYFCRIFNRDNEQFFINQERFPDWEFTH
jgi:hypothetical protein